MDGCDGGIPLDVCGYLTRVSDVSVTLSLFDCEIGDGTYQIRGTTGSVVTIAVAPATPLVVLRWTYTGNAAVDYIDFKAVAVGAQLVTDVVVGLCVYAGSVLTGFDYLLRTNPNILDLFLKVEPTVPASMNLRVRAGRSNYGSGNLEIVDQLTPLFAAPGSNSRIDLVQINPSGAVVVTQGAVSASPVPPDYNGWATLAEVTLNFGQLTITSASIKDVRAVVGSIVVVPDHLSVLTGTIGHGGTIPLPTGYTQAQCKWLVSANDIGPQGSSSEGWREFCSADINRVVTVYARNSVYGSIAYGTANFIIIGTK
jgi:hypothetical protein